MEPRLGPLAAILDLNTDLLLNCLEGLSEIEAQQRLLGCGNSVAFLASHLTDTRHFLAMRIGQPLANPLARYVVDARSIEDIREWPSLAEIRAAWLGISAHLQAVLGSLAREDLDRPNADRFPLTDGTQLGLIAFLVQHDSYHLGQVGFLRRQCGKPPMSYARGPRASTAPGAA
jgi:uncharacterized damage-inducible protein DinB